MTLSREEFRARFLNKVKGCTCVIANSDPDSYLSVLLLLVHNPRLAKNVRLMHSTQVLDFLSQVDFPVAILDTAISREILVRMPQGSVIVDHHAGTLDTVRPCRDVLLKKKALVLFHMRKCTARLIYETLFFDQPLSYIARAVDAVDRGMGTFPYSEWHVSTGFAARFEEVFLTNPTGIIALAHAGFITSPHARDVEVFRRAGASADTISQKVVARAYESGKVVAFEDVAMLLIQKPQGRRGVSLLSVKIFDQYPDVDVVLFWAIHVTGSVAVARYNVRARTSSGVNVVEMFTKFGAVGGGHPTAASFSDSSPENIHKMWCS